MDRLPVWHREDVELVAVDHTDPEQVEQWARFLHNHAPGWVFDAITGEIRDRRTEGLVERCRELSRS